MKLYIWLALGLETKWVPARVCWSGKIAAESAVRYTFNGGVIHKLSPHDTVYANFTPQAKLKLLPSHKISTAEFYSE